MSQNDNQNLHMDERKNITSCGHCKHSNLRGSKDNNCIYQCHIVSKIIKKGNIV